METSSAEMLFENFHLKNREFGHGKKVHERKLVSWNCKLKNMQKSQDLERFLRKAEY